MYENRASEAGQLLISPQGGNAGEVSRTDEVPSDSGKAYPADRQPREIRIKPEERQMLLLAAEGQSMSAIARKLFTSDRTLRRQARALCDKLGVGTIIEAVAWAARQGLI
jgi:DNA-binding NarL/FixJ family response regulator